MPYSIKVEFQLVKLPEKLVIPLDLGVSTLDQVASSVKLGHGEHLALFAKVDDLLFDLVHDPVKVPS